MSQAAVNNSIAPNPVSEAGRYKYWRGFFQDVVHQHAYQSMRVEGTLPDEISGTYYQNGPANFSSHGKTRELFKAVVRGGSIINWNFIK